MDGTCRPCGKSGAICEESIGCGCGNVCCNCGRFDQCPGDSTVPIFRDPRNIEFYLDPANCGGCSIECAHSEAPGGGADCVAANELDTINLVNGLCRGDGSCNPPRGPGLSCTNGNCVPADPSQCGNNTCVPCSTGARLQQVDYCRKPNSDFGFCTILGLDEDN